MNKYEEKELNKIISIEDNMYLADNATIFNDSHGDDRYLNLYEFRNTDKEYKLTDNGYVLKENKKGWWFMTKDIAKGTARGTAKLTEGVGSLALATLEKMNVVSEGTVNDFSNFYQENIYDNEGFFRLTEPETLAGGFAEGISQFLVPGLGAYGAMAKIFKARGVWPFIYRALTAEAITVGAAQVPGDPNFASFLSNFLDIDKTKADNLAKEFYIYITTPENVEGGYNADDVFNDKFKAIIGDAPLGPVGETLVPLFKMFARGVKKLRGNKEMINEIEKTIVNAPDNQVFDIDNPPPGVIEDKMPQKGDVDYEEPASGGLSKDRDAMDDLNKDIAAQVEEVDTSYQIDNKAISKFNTSLDKQNISLVSMEPQGDIMHDMYVEQMNIIKSVINNPEKEITVYRVVPKNVKNAKINEGDYVALTKKLAGAFGEPQTHQIIETKVKAKDIYTSDEGQTGASFLYKKRGNN